MDINNIRKIIRKEVEILFEFQVSDVKDMMTKSPYENFVDSLGYSFRDPKVKAALEGGMNDGDLVDDVISANDIFIPCNELIPIQNEIEIKSTLRRVLSTPSRMKDLIENNSIEIKGPIVTLDGKYIIDGHHRWAQAYCINPNISIHSKNLTGLKNINSALKAVQTAIISSTGGYLPTESVNGQNLFVTSESNTKEYIINQVTDDVVNIFSFYVKNKNKEEVKIELANYIWKNIQLMRKNNHPISGAYNRDIMPQTYEIPGGVNQVVKKLKSGTVNMNPPFSIGRNN